MIQERHVNVVPLIQRFGHLDAAISPHATDVGQVAQSGVLGSGCSASYPTMPDEGSMLQWARIDRVLLTLSVEHREVLRLAYGDAGAIASEDGRLESRRWRAVAVLVPAAQEHATAWAAHRTERLEPGPAVDRWLCHVATKIGNRKASRDERARWDRVRQTAMQMLSEALASWDRAWRARERAGLWGGRE